MLLIHHPPLSHPASQWIQMIWEWEGYCPKSPQEHILPHGMTEISWNLSRPHRIEDHINTWAIRDAVLIGPRTTPYRVDTSGTSHLFGILFKPTATFDYLGTSVSELLGTFTPLEVFKRGAVLMQRVQEAVSSRARFDAVLMHFASLPAPMSRRESGLLLNVWDNAHGRHTSVRCLTERLGISAPTFTQHTRHQLGLRPAQLRQLLMFRAAVERLALADLSLVETALEVGYCDQAHLHRAFRRHGGITPGQLAPAMPAHPYNLVLP